MLSVFASWTHRETRDFESLAPRDIDPKNLLGVGGFFQTDRGLLPLSLFRAPHFRYREMAGGLTADGSSHGGEELTRVVNAYLEGTF